MLSCSRRRHVAFAAVADFCFVELVHWVVFVAAGHRHGSKFESFDAFHGSHANAGFVGARVFFAWLELEGCDVC